MCLAETICVPVTLLSLLHCLPLLRRLAAGQRRPVGEAPFEFEVCAAPALRSCGRVAHLPTRVETRPDLAVSLPRNSVRT